MAELVYARLEKSGHNSYNLIRKVEKEGTIGKLIQTELGTALRKTWKWGAMCYADNCSISLASGLPTSKHAEIELRIHMVRYHGWYIMDWPDNFTNRPDPTKIAAERVPCMWAGIPYDGGPHEHQHFLIHFDLHEVIGEVYFNLDKWKESDYNIWTYSCKKDKCRMIRDVGKCSLRSIKEEFESHLRTSHAFIVDEKRFDSRGL